MAPRAAQGPPARSASQRGLRPQAKRNRGGAEDAEHGGGKKRRTRSSLFRGPDLLLRAPRPPRLRGYLLLQPQDPCEAGKRPAIEDQRRSSRSSSSSSIRAKGSSTSGSGLATSSGEPHSAQPNTSPTSSRPNRRTSALHTGQRAARVLRRVVVTSSSPLRVDILCPILGFRRRESHRSSIARYPCCQGRLPRPGRISRPVHAFASSMR